MKPHISVIVPVYNNDVVLLEKAIDSIMNQTYSQFEIVLVNDGSKDTTVLDFMESQSLREKIVYINNNVNRGISSARNIGIEKANGEWITFLDADDYMEKSCLAAYEKAIDDEVEIIAGNFYRVDEKDNITGSSEIEKTNTVYDHLSNGAIWNRLYRKTFLEKNDIQFPEGCYAEDLYFLAKAYYRAKSIKSINAFTVRNYVNSQSTSRGSAFKSLNIKQLPLTYFKDLVAEINGNEFGREDATKMACYGFVINSVLVIGCLMTRGESDYDKIRVIHSEAAEIISQISDRDIVVKNWAKYGKSGRAMNCMILYVSSGKDEKQIMARLLRINKFLRKMMLFRR